MFYIPLKANDGKHKYYIITNKGVRVYFGAIGFLDYTKHKDEKRKKLYISRHQKNENWGKSGKDTAGFWSRWLLWNKPTIKESYDDIRKMLM